MCSPWNPIFCHMVLSSFVNIVGTSICTVQFPHLYAEMVIFTNGGFIHDFIHYTLDYNTLHLNCIFNPYATDW